jgi:hypothetical protein
VEVLMVVTQDFGVQDLNGISKVSENMKKKISSFPVWEEITSLNTTKEIKPFPFVVKHIKAIFNCCHKKVCINGSSMPLNIYIQDKTTYNQLYLKCRQKYYQKNPERHRENDLMKGIINKTGAMQVYKLSSEDLEAIPHTPAQHSKYGNTLYAFKCAEVFSKACLVHGRVVILRHVSKVADNVYLN